jgi:hypothetical protein
MKISMTNLLISLLDTQELSENLDKDSILELAKIPEINHADLVKLALSKQTSTGRENDFDIILPTFIPQHFVADAVLVRLSASGSYYSVFYKNRVSGECFYLSGGDYGIGGGPISLETTVVKNSDVGDISIYYTDFDIDENIVSADFNGSKSHGMFYQFISGGSQTRRTQYSSLRPFTAKQKNQYCVAQALWSLWRWQR